MLKAETLNDGLINFADFGTRRAFNSHVHDRVLKTLIENSATLVGTSNLYLAMKYGIKPIGTKAHEWFMAHACMFGYRNATNKALQAWSDEFGANLGIALTDTFTTDVFLRNFGPYFAKLYDGVRQDSGCPYAICDKVINHYKMLDIDPLSKTIVFSDGLDVDKAILIDDYCYDKINASFGIGTFLTNDVGWPSLDIVIKLRSLTLPNHNGSRTIPAIKLSDDPGKACGDNKAIEHARYELGLEGE